MADQRDIELLLVQYDAGNDAARELPNARASDVEPVNDGRSPLHDAVVHESMDDFRRLLRDPTTDLNARAFDGRTPLIYTVCLGIGNMARELIAAGADVNVVSDAGWTALHWATILNNAPLVDLLLKNGANLHLRERCGRTMLHLAVGTEVARKLLDVGADPNAQDYIGSTPLHSAVADRNYAIFHLLLKENSVNPNVHMKNGSTALVLAAQRNLEDMVQALIAKGADVNATDSKGRTQLHLAVADGAINAVVLLLKYGADKDVKDNSGQTPLHLAVRFIDIAKVLIDCGVNPNRKDMNGRTPLHLAVAVAPPHSFKFFVEEVISAGADINAEDNNKQTALHLAVALNKVTAVDTLLKNGANVEAEDDTGKTPLHLALRNTGVAKKLLDARAGGNSQDNEGSTLLPLAVAEGPRLLKLLIDDLLNTGADINLADDSKQTALNVAMALDKIELVEILLAYGAKPKNKK